MEKFFKSILDSERVLTSSSSSHDSGFYTLGIKSNPKRVTVSNQQLRAYLFADALMHQIIKRIEENQSNDVIKICIIGAGFSGISLSLRLIEYFEKYKNIEINLLEKGPYLMHIQRGCETREISPFVHMWPSNLTKEKSIRKIRIKNFLSDKKIYFLESIYDWGCQSAGDLMTHYARHFLKQIKNLKVKGLEANLKVYENVKDLIILNDKNIKINFTGSEIKDHYGTKENPTYTFCNKTDYVIFATGFGVERNLSLKHLEKRDLYFGNSYWRNDSFGQTSLYNKSNSFLISGYGDGAINDFLRLKVLDFSPERLLSYLFDDHYQDKEASHELSEADIQAKNAINFVINKLKEIKESDGSFVSFFENYEDDECVNRFFECINEKLTPLLLDVHIVFLLKKINHKSLLQILFDNENAFFYNRFLLYCVWRVSEKVEFELIENNLDSYADLKKYIDKYNIIDSNIIIRHGSDKGIPINDIFKYSGMRELDFANDKLSSSQKIIKKCSEYQFYINGYDYINENFIFEYAKYFEFKVNISKHEQNTLNFHYEESFQKKKNQNNK